MRGRWRGKGPAGSAMEKNTTRRRKGLTRQVRRKKMDELSA